LATRCWQIAAVILAGLCVGLGLAYYSYIETGPEPGPPVAEPGRYYCPETSEMYGVYRDPDGRLCISEPRALGELTRQERDGLGSMLGMPIHRKDLMKAGPDASDDGAGAGR